MLTFLLSHLGFLGGGLSIAALIASVLCKGSPRIIATLVAVIVIGGTILGQQLEISNLKSKVATLQPQLDQARQVNAENLNTIQEIMKDDKAAIDAITADRDRSILAQQAAIKEKTVIKRTAASCVGPVHPAISNAMQWVRQTATSPGKGGPPANTGGAPVVSSGTHSGIGGRNKP